MLERRILLLSLNVSYSSNITLHLMQALRHLRQISQEVSQPNVTGWGRRPAALRALSQRLSKYVIPDTSDCSLGSIH